MIDKKSSIQLSESTKDKLTAEGKMGETYDALVLRLLAELVMLRNGRKPK